VPATRGTDGSLTEIDLILRCFRSEISARLLIIAKRASPNEHVFVRTHIFVVSAFGNASADGRAEPLCHTATTTSRSMSISPAESAQAVIKQLTARGSLSTANVKAILSNINSPLQHEPEKLLEIAIEKISHRKHMWSLRDELNLIYLASKPGGVAIADLSRDERLLFRTQKARLLSNKNLAMISPGRIGLPEDSEHQSFLHLLKPRQRGAELPGDDPTIMAAVARGAIVVVQHRAWSVPPGPAFSPTAAAAWKTHIENGRLC